MQANFCQIGGLLLLLCTCGSPLIVPTGLVSLLHYIYSRIPVINKGTDSRLGVGFRFGPHADLQFLVELGPQQLTQSLGDPQNPAPSGFDDLAGPAVPEVANSLHRGPSVRSSAVRDSGDVDLPGAQEVSNQLSHRSSPAWSSTRSSGVRSSGVRSPGAAKTDERKARSGAADWLGRWQAGIRGRATRSHQAKTENVGSTSPKKATSTPLLTAFNRFRDLWGAGRRAAVTAP